MQSRRKSTLRKLALAGAAAAALVLTACAGGGGGDPTNGSGEVGEPVEGGDLVLALNVDTRSLDPAICPQGGGWSQCQPIFGTLMRYNIITTEFEPGLAESLESEDGVHWTLKLRPGLQFSDGTAFDADAVVFNWERILDPATQSPSLATASTVKEWTVVDDVTIEFELISPNFQLPWQFVYGGMGMIGSPTAIEAAGDDVSNNPVGAGPFTLKEWTRGTQLVYEKNDLYFEEGKPYVDTYTIKTIGQDDQRLNALRSGEIDIDWSLLVNDAETMAAEGYNVLSEPMIGGTGVMFNLEDPVVSDPLLREAMLSAFDSAQINAALYPGSVPVDQYLFPESPYRDDSRGMFPPKDLDHAQEVFDEYLDKTGQTEVTVTYTAYAGIPQLEAVAEMIQAQMNQIEGLNFEINGVDGAALSTAQATGDFQLLMGATLGYQMDSMYDYFHSSSTRNYSKYSNPIVDEALTLARTSNDPDEVADAFKTAAGQVSKDAPVRMWRYQIGFLIFGDNVHVPEEAMFIHTGGSSMWVQDVWMTEQ
ncbi:ABC transporter substrate-binding protein [Microbacterium sp.]|uniref:ABC transporter substrate-binding protein n=1 Tax=Microbacterium sp. TaxID=51671 RepID=UPI0037C95351